jgi:hypothetical protein
MGGRALKGLEHEVMYFLVILVTILLLLTVPAGIGAYLAEKQWAGLKVHTMSSIKGTVLWLEAAPSDTRTCVPISGCRQVILKQNSVELIGPKNELFREPVYISSGLSTRSKFYSPAEECEAAVGCKSLPYECFEYEKDGKMQVYCELGGDESYSAPCGSGKPFFICFIKTSFESVTGASSGTKSAIIVEGLRAPP